MKIIPDEQFEWVSRRLCRGIAAALVSAMRHADLTFSEIDTLLRKKNWSRGIVIRLIEGRSATINDVSAIALACGCVLDLHVVPVEQNEPETETSPPEHLAETEAGNSAQASDAKG